jgi:hypothetical protein
MRVIAIQYNGARRAQEGLSSDSSGARLAVGRNVGNVARAAQNEIFDRNSFAFRHEMPTRHARACRGHPHLGGPFGNKDGDGGDKPGHDEGEAELK